MKNDLLKLVRWFCRHFTFNDLASVVPVLQEVLTGSRLMELKPPENRPPHYRQFRVDPTPHLLLRPNPKSDVPNWQVLQQQHREQHDKPISTVRHRGGRAAPEKCRCQHCNAPARYLYLNNGKLGSQVRCKICKRTTPTSQSRRESKSCYWCPHCGNALFHWKEDGICTAYKCPNKHCPVYKRNLAALTAEERAICGYNLSNSRKTEPALSLLTSCYGPPDYPKCETAALVTDGLPSYDSAVVAYNTAVREHSEQDLLTKRTVIGLRNLDSESEEYRPFKQLVERLNRTCKFHTRPRAGFKSFDGVVALTTLFVAYYNFIRPHGYLKHKPPVQLSCLQGETLYPKMWVELLRQAA